MLNKIRTAIKHPDRVPPYLIRQLDIGLVHLRNTIGYNTKSLELNDYSATFMANTLANVRYLQRLPEQDVLVDFLPRLSPDDVLWDIGANIGLYTCFAGNLGVEVVSFEPDNPTRSHLRENINLNDIDGTILPYGLNDERDEIQREVNMQRENKPTTVETYTGDEVLHTESNNISPPTVIKMDIEGMEFSALRGLEKIIEQVRLMYIELHSEHLSQRGESTGDIKYWILERGFEISELTDGSHNPIIRCEK